MYSKIECEDIENTNLPFQIRKALSEKAALSNDTRINCFIPKMIEIPGGEFTMGVDTQTITKAVEEFEDILNVFKKNDVIAWFSKSFPPHKMIVNPFRVSKYLVTNKEFNQFFFDTYGSVYEVDNLKLNHPAKYVSFDLAKQYCSWLSAKLKRKYRLLKEEEWEWIATNGGETRFPWGNNREGLFANTAEVNINETTAVGLFPEGFSRNGIADLGGNVQEWVETLYKPYPGGKVIRDRLYHFGNTIYNVLRGGCYSLNMDLCLGYRRHGYFPNYSITGFRICETI